MLYILPLYALSILSSYLPYIRYSLVKENCFDIRSISAF
jgi:hypothetical protein